MKTLIRFFVLGLCIVCGLSSPRVLNAETRFRGVTVGENINAADIAVLKSWKVNLVRFQLNYPSADTASLTAYDAWLDDELDKIAGLLPIFQQNGIKVALLMYMPPGGFQQYKPLPRHRVFTSEDAKNAFVAAWQKITTRFKGDDRIYGFDLLNEPREITSQAAVDNWDNLSFVTASAVRAIDASRLIIIEPSDFKKIDKLIKVRAVSNIAFSVHYYYYWQFVHQGLFRKYGTVYPTRTINRRGMKKFQKKVVAVSRAAGVPVYVSEVTVVRWAPKASAVRYLRDAINEIEAQGWDWTYHSFREADVWSLEHSDSRKSNALAPKPTARLKLMQKFFARN